MARRERMTSLIDLIASIKAHDKLREEMIEQRNFLIGRAHSLGMSYRAIAAVTDLSYQRIAQIIKELNVRTLIT